MSVRRHETDPISLAFAVIFLAIGGAFLFGDLDAFEFVSVWALPAVLLATGIVLGAVALGRHRKAAGESVEMPADRSDLTLDRPLSSPVSGRVREVRDDEGR